MRCPEMEKRKQECETKKVKIVRHRAPKHYVYFKLSTSISQTFTASKRICLFMQICNLSDFCFYFFEILITKKIIIMITKKLNPTNDIA